MPNTTCKHCRKEFAYQAVEEKPREHRLLCGDSTNAGDVSKVMDGKKAALFSTDPPFLVDYTGADRPNNSGKDWSDSYREIDIKDAEEFFRSVFTVASAHLAEEAAWYCWHAHKRAALIERIWDELGVLNHQQIIWVKPVALHGFSFWPYRHEPCLMGWKQGHKPAHDGDNSHTFTSVWRDGSLATITQRKSLSSCLPGRCASTRGQATSATNHLQAPGASFVVPR